MIGITAFLLTAWFIASRYCDMTLAKKVLLFTLMLIATVAFIALAVIDIVYLWNGWAMYDSTSGKILIGFLICSICGTIHNIRTGDCGIPY